MRHGAPAPLLSFRSLQHVRDAKAYASAGIPARFVPPAGFGCPLGGLRLSRPGRVCFTPTALVGFALRSILPPAVSGAFPRRSAHVPLLPSILPGAALAEACAARFRAGPTGRGFWALTRRRVAVQRSEINLPKNTSSHGISLSRQPGCGAGRISPAIRSHAWFRYRCRFRPSPAWERASQRIKQPQPGRNPPKRRLRA